MIAFQPISPLQRTWLLELGLERAFLARLPQAQPLGQSAAIAAAPAQEAAAAPQTAQLAGRNLDDAGSPAPASAPAAATDAMSARDQALAVLRKSGARPVAAAPVEEVVQRPAVLIQPEKAQDMASLLEQVQACQECGLHTGRAQVVFGSELLSEPDWMIIGEAPGTSDDRSAQPFDGKAGLLLQAMLNSAIPDASVYKTHLVKCRPLGNRPPTQEELAACRAFLDAQIRLVQPRRLLAVGHLAAVALSGRDEDLEALRGQALTYTDAQGRSLPLVVTYHPASLLLRPQHKANAWRDLSLLRELQGQS
ncbi:uracil-DNA glycosylase [Alcaligenes faecalis]|uniref:uracil-DNA glycosylase n=1 Tax=Alcaligenes TaxID=507 RepID=UPI00204184BB|nr:uracil-DNA glycosylase [Alcaligenes faecalis]MCM2559376.1 uracil-DNA glycosylase [Alcaligenes faecalis]MCM2622212.1 uracil-DNA glycosylase [Alcaligenes faecalis]MDK7585293.1 uracil-DNA glycosylase [Alcaligenes phenolicus]